MKKGTCLLSLGLFLITCCSLQATILPGADGNTNDSVPQDHGSFAQDTPEIALTWEPTGGGNNANNQWEIYRDWPNAGTDGIVYQLGSSSIVYKVIFTPNAKYNVVINSLDLNVWSGGGSTDVSWDVTGSVSGQLGSGVFTTADASAVTHNINLAGSKAEVLTLSLQQTSGLEAYLGMDNLNFSQVQDLPEGSIEYSSPVDGAVEVPLAASLVWDTATAEGVAGYYVYLGTSLDQMNRQNSTMLAKGTGSFAVNLEADNTYYWQIEQAMYNGTNGIYSAGDPNNYTVSPWQFSTVKSKVIFDPAYPVDSRVKAGETVVFTTDAEDPLGGTIAYQWYYDSDPTTPYDGVALSDSSKYSGTATATLTIYDAQVSDHGAYYCSGINASNYAKNSVSANLVIKRMIAHWTFDSADLVNGKYVDIVGGNDATAEGKTVFADGIVDNDMVTDPVLGGAIFISDDPNGCGDVGPFNPSEETGRFSLSAWVQHQEQSDDVAWNMIASKRDGWSSLSQSYWQFMTTNTGTVKMQSKDLSTIETARGLIVEGQWHHVVVTFDGSSSVIYVDGMEAASGGFIPAEGADATFRIGRNDQAIERFEGAIDDMQVFNYDLSAEDVVDLFYAETGTSKCIYGNPTGDLDGDCKVDLLDLSMLAGTWLDSGYYPR